MKLHAWTIIAVAFVLTSCGPAAAPPASIASDQPPEATPAEPSAPSLLTDRIMALAYIDPAWRDIIDAMRIVETGDAKADEATVHAFQNMGMLTYVGGGLPDAYSFYACKPDGDEFERQRWLGVAAPKIAAFRASKIEQPVTRTFYVPLGQYNFQRQGFPIDARMPNPISGEGVSSNIYEVGQDTIGPDGRWVSNDEGLRVELWYTTALRAFCGANNDPSGLGIPFKQDTEIILDSLVAVSPAVAEGWTKNDFRDGPRQLRLDVSFIPRRVTAQDELWVEIVSWKLLSPDGAILAQQSRAVVAPAADKTSTPE